MRTAMLSRRDFCLAAAAATAAVLLPVTRAHAAGPVNQVVVWGDSMAIKWPKALAGLLGIPVLARAVGGDTIAETQQRFDTWTEPDTGHVLWGGHVDLNRQNNSFQLVPPTIAEMAATVPPGLFMPLSLSNGPDAPEGSRGYRRLTGVNRELARTHRSSYVEMRGYLISDGLRVANIAPTAEDLRNIEDDVPPQSLRVAPGGGNPAHLNDTGRRVVAGRLDQLIRAAGWLG